MSVADRYDTEQWLSIGAGAGLGILGFALWMGLEPSGVWGVVGIGLLFVGGIVTGTGSVGFKRGIRNSIPAMGMILVGEVVVMVGIMAARPGTGGPEAILIGALVPVFLFVLVGTIVFAPFLLLAGLGGWIREKVSGPVEDDRAVGGDHAVDSHHQGQATSGPSPNDDGAAEDDDGGTDWRRADDV